MGPLRSGQTVAVVGGGPAGASCAIMLRRLASTAGISLQVVLFEPKDFVVQRNVCVGVLSPPFRALLNQLGLALPEDIIQRRIKGYMLHSKKQTVMLEEKSGGEHTLVVARADLDRFLLRGAQETGASVVGDTVVDIKPGPDHVVVSTQGGASLPADVVVGAFGLDEKMLSVFEARVPGFRRPPVTKSILTEIPSSIEDVDTRMDNTVHAMLVGVVPGTEFGALTPNLDRVTVNIAGENVTDRDLDALLRLRWSRELVPNATLTEPRLYHAFPCGPARNAYGDRVVAIGNASGLLRPLKGKGINTGMITGIRAATTMIEDGISKRAFDAFYSRCHDLTSEFKYGGALSGLYHLADRVDALDAVLTLARRDPLLYQAFYDMVSGEGSYRDIIRRSARPRLMGKIILAIARYRIEGR
ncbi:MAG: NAD(P)/FAD-dependent oxidoreductase [Dehalococcoidia bacterium]|nr:NAD(P)/FAD-dependent oxidoreductase [Dehalococcoidia bacterium]